MIKRKNIKKKFKANKSGDLDENFLEEFTSAILTLSSSKVGAIITFERRDALDSYIDSGVRIDAPLNPELLKTIFYPGTPLHDGAVIIKNGIIAAASVYYTPTIRALTGRFGARHRAAIGISEVSDAVTVIVSEETGRISFAYQGELETIARDSFKQVLIDYLER